MVGAPLPVRWDARGLTGNPRIRNRSSLLGRLQVGEYSAIVGLIKRAQTLFGWVFTVSGVVCAFRKRALHEAGWWSPATLTDDVDMTWRIQIAGWTVAYEPKALCWILMPETLGGLWRQRLRWSEGGTQTVISLMPQMFHRRLWRLWIMWFSYVLSVLWAYAVLAGLVMWCVQVTWLGAARPYPAFNRVPQWWGAVITATYLLQASVSLALDQRFERGCCRDLLAAVVSALFLGAAGAHGDRRGAAGDQPPDGDVHGHVGEPGSRRAMKTAPFARRAANHPHANTGVDAGTRRAADARRVAAGRLLPSQRDLLRVRLLPRADVRAHNHDGAGLGRALETASRIRAGGGGARRLAYVLGVRQPRPAAGHTLAAARAAARREPGRARGVERGGAGGVATGEGANRGHRFRSAGDHACGWTTWRPLARQIAVWDIPNRWIDTVTLPMQECDVAEDVGFATMKLAVQTRFCI